MKKEIGIRYGAKVFDMQFESLEEFANYIENFDITKLNYETFPVLSSENENADYTNTKNFSESLKLLKESLTNKPTVQTNDNSNKKQVTIYYSLLCPNKPGDKSSLLNRGLITIELIKLLEMNGYNVRVVLYGLSNSIDEKEVLRERILAKNFNERLDVERLKFPLYNSAMYRLQLRLIETLEVSKHWDFTYGYPIDKDLVKSYLSTYGNYMNENDIIISSPKEMWITGQNITLDTMNLLYNKINIGKYIPSQEIVNDFVKTFK